MSSPEAGAAAGGGAGGPGAGPAGAGAGSHLRASVVIGNIRCQKEYLPTESAFHASEVPAKAREARLAVKAWKRPPVLGPTSKPEWNADASLPRALCERKGAQLIPRAAKPARPQGPEKDETASGGWNISTTLETKERAQLHKDLHERSVRHSRAINSALSADYTGPLKAAVKHMETLREARDGAVSATSAAGAAVVGGGGRAISPPRHTFKPATNTVTRKFKRYTHSGSYGATPFERERCWSCCMQTDPLAKGCIVAMVNPDAYNFVSVT